MMEKNNIIIERYWVSKFHEELSIVDLTNHVQPESANEVRNFKYQLNESLLHSINRLTNSSDIGRYVYCISALDILLAFYSGQVDVLVVCPEINLNGKVATDNLIFHRNRITPTDVVKDVLNKHKQSILEDYQHQDYRYESVLKHINDVHAIDPSALFQFGFCDLKIQSAENIKACDLRILLHFDLGTPFLSFEYTNKFTSAFIQKFAEHYVKILSIMPESLNVSVDKLEILSSAERHTLLYEFNETEKAFPSTSSFIELFEARVNSCPDQVALTFNGKNFTYRQLNNRANRLANHVRGLVHINQDDFIALIMDRSDDMLVAILSAWKLGAAYVPIDHTYPEQRIVSTLEDCNPKAVLSTTGVCSSNLVNAISKESKYLEVDQDNGNEWCDNLDLHIPSSTLAYVIYTSGSTGKPKGAMIEHIGMLNHMYAKINDLNLDNTCVISQNASHCFDISVWQFFTALLIGGRTVVYSNEDILDPSGFLDKLERDEVTILEVVPSYLTALLDIPQIRSNAYFSKLNFLIVTGETLKRSLVEMWFEIFPTIKLVNAYGPTEASDDITHCIMENTPDMDNIPVGKAVQNFSIYILNNFRQLCPIGIAGELYVSGIGVGRGYLNDAVKTKNAFNWDPFKENQRMYKTGDVARYLPDGNIEFLGRKDHQVKIRGHRIELGEIENKLFRIEGVSQAVIIVNTDDNKGNYLVAYVQVSKSNPIDSDKIKEMLQADLPHYMVPAYILKLEHLPLTANGKIDRKALPDPVRIIGKDKDAVAPLTQMEQLLFDIWKEVLGIDQLSVTDNFFELGGHSLKVMRLVSMIHKRANIKVEPQDVFSNATIKDLSIFLDGKENSSFSPIYPIDEDDFYEISHAQKRLWIADRFQDNNTAYNIPTAFEIRGKLSVSALVDSFKQSLVRHEILRTTFGEIDGKPVQIICPYEKFDFKVNYSDLIGEDITESFIKQRIKEETDRPFDLIKGPLLSVNLFRTGEDQYLLILNIHHIIFDAWSGNLLMNEWLLNYKHVVKGTINEIEPLSFQNKDFVAWQNKHINDSSNHKSYWLNKLGGTLPVLNMPSDFARPSLQTYAGDTFDISLKENVVKELKALGNANSASLFMVLHAAFNVLLYKYSGQTDVILGTPVSGRDHVDLKNQIGFYINTLALRTEFSKTDSFLDLLSNVKKVNLEALSHQVYPFDILVDDLNLPRDISRSPVFDVMIDMINYENPIINVNEDLVIRSLEIEYSKSKYDIVFIIYEGLDKLDFRFEFNPDLYRKDTIEKMAGRYVALLNSIIKNPSQTIESSKMEESISIRKISKTKTV